MISLALQALATSSRSTSLPKRKRKTKKVVASAPNDEEIESQIRDLLHTSETRDDFYKRVIAIDQQTPLPSKYTETAYLMVQWAKKELAIKRQTQMNKVDP
jgi:hypothetical protein